MSGYDHKPSLAMIAFALMILWVCCFSHLAAMGLTGADEPRYAFIARGMAATGDWVTPRLYGQPWFEKPILYYWTAAASFRMLPANPEWAARLPSALAALLAALAMAWTARRIYGPRAGYFTLLILPSSAAFIGFARAASPDMLFASTLAIALAAASAVCIPPAEAIPAGPPAGLPAAATPPSRAESSPRRAGFLALLIFGAALGFASLAKGPAAVILAAGSVFCWALLSSQWRRATRLLHPVAILSWSAVALPWYVICALRNPDFLRVFIFQHNFARYLTPVFQHRQPFWYFLPILLIGIFPWTPAIAWLAVDGWRAIRRNDWRGSPALFFACWTAFPFVFFSFSQSKLPGYVLPCFAPLALLIADWMARLAPAEDKCKRAFAVIGGLWLAASVSFFQWRDRIPPEAGRLVHHEILILVGAAAVLGLVIFAAAAAGDALPSVMITALAMAMVLEFIDVRMLPKLDPLLSARPAAAQVTALKIPEASLSAMHLRREWQYGLEFYLRAPLREWELPLTDNRWVPPFLFLDKSDFNYQRRFYPDLVVLSDHSPHAILVRLTPIGPFAPFQPPHPSR